MQELLSRKLHEYISNNNPDLLIKLEQENKVTEYLKENVSAVDDLINDLLEENKPAPVIEELCLYVLTKTLRPSRFNYLKTLLEEEFPHDFERLRQNNTLATELINMIAVCEPVFDELDFSEEKDNDRHMKYATIGAVYEYLQKGGSQ